MYIYYIYYVIEIVIYEGSPVHNLIYTHIKFVRMQANCIIQ